jgi:hypothetical protein
MPGASFERSARSFSISASQSHDIMKLRSSTFALLLAVVIVRPLVGQTLGSVGTSRITRRDIEHRIAIEKAYGGTLTSEAAFVSLVNDALDREVARTLGLLPDSAEMQRFSDHADRTSKAPEILAAVREIFATDTAAYRWMYLAPRLINIKLHAYFIRDTVLHAAERRSIQQAYALAAGGTSFADAAERTGLQHRIDSLRDHRGSLPPELARYAADTVLHDPYRDLVRGLVPGRLFGTIVETDGDYRVLRLVGRSDSVQVVEVIVAGKGDFDKWFRAQAMRLPISITDRKLHRRIVEKYPQLWWVERVHRRENRQRRG